MIGEPRLLLFSPDSRILYFTTTLNNSVQAYSIATNELLRPLPSHPSPPSTVAISSNGAILLSASPDPPTIYLQDRRYEGSAPLDFCPTDARSPTSCAAFQRIIRPTQSSYCTNFVLGFQDGLLAMYRVLLPSIERCRGAASIHQTSSLQLHPVRVGVVQKLHKAAMGGLIAVEFIPGYKSRVVSIRHDGKCRLVDFQGEGDHVSGPATCLSVSANGQIDSQDAVDMEETLLLGDDSEDARQTYYENETLISIGTHAGKVLVFNVLGLWIHEIVLDAPITAIEWVGVTATPSALPDHASSRAPASCIVSDKSTGLCSVSLIEEACTVKKTTSPSKQAVHAPLGLVQPLCLFSNGNSSRISDLPGSEYSHAMRGAPPRVEEVFQQPRQTFFRPRISAETFHTPAVPKKHQPHRLHLVQSSALSSAAPTKPQGFQAPKPSRLPRSSALQISLTSSEDSESSESELFTPPDTHLSKRTTTYKPPPPSRQDMVKTTSRKASPSPQMGDNTPGGSIYRPPLSSIMKHSSSNTEPPNNGMLPTLVEQAIRHKTPRRRVRIAEETPVCMDMSSDDIVYRHPAQATDGAVMEREDHAVQLCDADNTMTPVIDTMTPVTDTSSLLSDIISLKQEMAALRSEYRMLKDLLLLKPPKN
ncbi:lipid metabolic process [Pyrenophora seminiperda CCB06]|uniref:Lipid metabolic process n=1 Tax=Pyrenophora seminiperda CCB06 TaxID=1302712 RepID=A0A3M7MD31_9PLEO|nr:lipid metabolic process [Pyrenophora seminiperda CCB06]